MANAVYHARNALPVFLTRGQGNEISITVLDSAGDAEVPGSGSIDIWDGSGVKVVDGATLTPASTTDYAVLASIVPTTEPLSDSWQVRWTMKMADGTNRAFVQPAHLVRWTLKAPVVESDVTTQHSEASDLLSASQDLTDILTVAWEKVLRRLLQKGRMPWLILDSFSLFDVHMAETLHTLFLDAHSSVGGSGKYLEMATYYREQADRLFGQVVLTYDDDQDGLPDAGEDGASAVGAAYMGGPGRGWRL